MFQQRAFDGVVVDSKDHINTLKDAIKNTPGYQLDPPIVVWWSGREWKVLDGHHRLIAYQQLAKDRKNGLVVRSIRVEVFEGTLDDAKAAKLDVKEGPVRFVRYEPPVRSAILKAAE